MPTVPGGEARAVADVECGSMLATVWLPASPTRVFRALVSDEITRWWVRPGVFDTREWRADVRAGGHWEASGIGGGKPYTLEGDFVAVDAPRFLQHSWRLPGVPASGSMLTYLVEPFEGGTWLTLRQEGFGARAVLMNTTIGWETSFARLAEILADEVSTTAGSGRE